MSIWKKRARPCMNPAARARSTRFFASRCGTPCASVVWLLVLLTLGVLVVQGIKVIRVEGRSSTISLPIELPRSWFYSMPLTVSAVSMSLTTLWLLLTDLAVLGGRPDVAVAAAPTAHRA